MLPMARATVTAAVARVPPSPRAAARSSPGGAAPIAGLGAAGTPAGPMAGWAACMPARRRYGPVPGRARQARCADSSKAGKLSFARAGSWDKVHVLITDKQVDRNFAKELVKTGIKLLRA